MCFELLRKNMGFCCLLGYVLMAVPAAWETPELMLNFLTAV